MSRIPDYPVIVIHTKDELSGMSLCSGDIIPTIPDNYKHYPVYQCPGCVMILRKLGGADS